MNRRPWLPLRALSGWTPKDLNGDLVAGITLAAIAIPEQMATARLGGFAPEIGFFAFVAGSVAFALFGANRHLSAGADSTITPLFAGGLALLATSGSPHYLALAAMLALMVGLIVALSGVLRLGWIADLLSVPVTTGFLAGIADPHHRLATAGLLGLPAESGETLRRVGEIAASLHLDQSLEPRRSALACSRSCSCAERISARIPGALIGMVLATLAVIVFDLKDRGVEVLGALPNGLPQAGLPLVSLDDAQALVPLALLIAIVVMVQTAATSRSFVPQQGEPRTSTAISSASAPAASLSGLFGAFAVNASPPRTAIVAQSGGRSQLSGLIAAAIVLALGAFGGSLLANVPQAALAGVLMFVAQHILRWQVFANVYRQAPVEFALILITMVAIVVLPIETGVAIGIGLSLLHGIWSATRTQPIELAQGARHFGVVAAGRARTPANSFRACWSRHSRRRCPSSMPTTSSAVCCDLIDARNENRQTGRAGGQQHRRDRLHRGAGADRHHPPLPQDRRGLCHSAAWNRCAPRRRWRGSALPNWSARSISSTASTPPSNHSVRGNSSSKNRTKRHD